MMESLVFFVLVAAILVIFLHDFGKLLKKLFAKPWFALFVPLLMVSYTLVTFESFFVWLLVKAQIYLISAVEFLASLLPFTIGASSTAAVILLMLVTFLPMGGIMIWNKRRMFQAVPNVWMVGLFTWLIVSTLLGLSLVT